jgi:hypothetical protein
MKLLWCLLLTGLVMVTAGCVSSRWVRSPGPSDVPLRLGEARVAHVRGHSVDLHSVVVTADSVIGWRARAPGAGERVALDRAEVLYLTRPRFDFPRTALVVLLGAALAMLWAVEQSG